MTEYHERLTDSTRVWRTGERIAVTDSESGLGGATLLALDDERVFPCGWLYRVSFNELCPWGCGCEGAHGEMLAEAGPGGIVRECEALAVGFDNGFACTAGHSHRNDVRHDYYDDYDEGERF